MNRQIRGYTARIVILVTIALLIIFIAVPTFSVLLQSFRIEKSMPLTALKEITLDAIKRLDPETRTQVIDRWVQSATRDQQLGATVGALELIGKPGTWDRTATFEEQTTAENEALSKLTDKELEAFEAEYPIAMTALNKRVALAFKVKEELSEEEFERLRSGKYVSLGFDHYQVIYKDERMRKAAKNSLMIAVLTCLFSVSIAYALSFGINRGGIVMPNIARLCILIPLISPPTVIAFSAILLFGRQGLITKGILDQTLGLINADEHNLYGLGGVVVAQVFSYLPIAFILIDNTLSKHDGSIEEAAAIMGASAWQIFCRITLPMSRPGINRAFILVFIQSLTDFGNPMVIGRGIPVISRYIYEQVTGFSNISLAAALCVWLIVPAICIYLLLERLGRRKRYETQFTGPPELPVPRGLRLSLNGIAASYFLLMGALYFTIIIGSFTVSWGVDYSFTINHYRSVPGLPGIIVSSFPGGGIVLETIKYAVIAAPVGSILAIIIAYIVERLRPPGRDLISFLALLPAVLPGVIFGIGYIVAFNLPFGIKELALTGTMSILVLNIMFSAIFVGVLAGRTALQRLDAAIDEAAEILGASLSQRFILVVIPMLGHALILGGLYMFMTAMTTLNSVIFLVSADHNIASQIIFNHTRLVYYGSAASKSVAIFGVVALALVLVQVMEKIGPRWIRLARGFGTK